MRTRHSNSFEASNISARAAICSMITQLVNAGLSRDNTAAVEIALTEAINNVVEHAYADGPRGKVHATCDLTDRQLSIEIRDTGRPFPDLQLPPGHPVDLGGQMSDLPEGGFGWFLIRELVSELGYRRQQGENILILRFDLSVPGNDPLP